MLETSNANWSQKEYEMGHIQNWPHTFLLEHGLCNFIVSIPCSVTSMDTVSILSLCCALIMTQGPFIEHKIIADKFHEIHYLVHIHHQYLGTDQVLKSWACAAISLRISL